MIDQITSIGDKSSCFIIWKRIRESDCFNICLSLDVVHRQVVLVKNKFPALYPHVDFRGANEIFVIHMDHN